MSARNLGLIVALACTPAFAPSSSWEIHLVTSGGFTGAGVGGIVVRSDGAAELFGGSRPRDDSPPPAVCRIRLSAADLADLAEAVRLAQPSTWRDRYVSPSNPHGCCDMLGWQLTLQRTEAGKSERVDTFWFDDGLAQSPQDLSAVRTRLQTVWSLMRERCAR